jgi:hypothetical protein
MFTPNPFFERVLAAENKTRQAMEQAAKPAETEANRLTHDIMPKGIGKEIRLKWVDGDLYLVNYAHGGHIDEWGSKNNPPYAPLRTAVRRAGFDLEEI